LSAGLGAWSTRQHRAGDRSRRQTRGTVGRRDEPRLLPISQTGTPPARRRTGYDRAMSAAWSAVMRKV
jgi:hypothetical protein